MQNQIRDSKLSITVTKKIMDGFITNQPKNYKMELLRSVRLA